MAIKRLSLGTGVTCPSVRYSPVLIAQAAATASVMMPGRFILGLGSGENLNEHITGLHWPPPAQRLDMLGEAIGAIGTLWRGGWQSHFETYFAIEKAKIFTMPTRLPPIIVAAAKPRAARLAGRVADGLSAPHPRLT